MLSVFLIATDSHSPSRVFPAVPLIDVSLLALTETAANNRLLHSTAGW
jgi:hypothetical protein